MKLIEGKNVWLVFLCNSDKSQGKYNYIQVVGVLNRDKFGCSSSVILELSKQCKYIVNTETASLKVYDQLENKILTAFRIMGINKVRLTFFKKDMQVHLR